MTKPKTGRSPKSLENTKQYQPESYYSDRLAESLNGQREVKTPSGNIDVLTDEEVIEVKVLENWRAAIGQLLSYASHYPGRTKRIHLIGIPDLDSQQEILAICSPIGIDVTWEDRQEIPEEILEARRVRGEEVKRIFVRAMFDSYQPRQVQAKEALMIITTQDKTTYKEFCDRHPELLRKLRYWASKRMGWKYSHLSPEGIEAASALHVEEYLTELVLDVNLSRSEDSILERVGLKGENYLSNLAAIQKWERVLSRQEKMVVAEYSPIKWPADFSGSWYSLTQAGEYIIWEEPVINSIDFEGRQVAEVTENAYECEVLNAKNLWIVDVDLKSDSYDSVVAISEHQALTALDAIAHQFPQYGFRVYKTAGGLRYLCTTQEMNPTAFDTRRLMENLYADPLYRRLCQFQETFRARLTPKPWRVDNSRLVYNRDTGKVEAGHAVCKLIKVVGSDVILPQFESIVKLHDDKTKALSSDYDLA